ncbi:MAG: addiction module protein [Planctomycetota bacterium]
MNISIDDIRRLPADQQLSLVEQIWDGLLASGQLLQQWQIEEVRSRAKELDERPEIAMTEDEMWRRVGELRNGE